MLGSEDLQIVRTALVRELETINHYQELHDASADERLRALLLHLMDEEKEHVAELTELLRASDPAQERHFQAGHAAQLRRDPRLGDRPRGLADPKPRSAWTVGSLLDLPR